MEITTRFENLYQYGEVRLVFNSDNSATVLFQNEPIGPFQTLYISNPEPRFIKERSLKGVLVLAGRTTIASSKRIAELGGSYFDLQGNYEFVAHSKRIIHRIAVSKNQDFPDLSRFLNVSNFQACQVLFSILKAEKPLKARDLQKVSQASLGLVGRIAHCLVQNGLLAKYEDGYWMNDNQKSELLERWKAYFQSSTLPRMKQAHYTTLLSSKECAQTIQNLNLPINFLEEDTNDSIVGAPKVLFAKTPDFESQAMQLSMIEDPKNGSTTFYFLDSTFLLSLCQNSKGGPFISFLMGTKKAEDVLHGLS